MFVAYIPIKMKCSYNTIHFSFTEKVTWGLITAS